jgi:hypothetical protein
VKAEHDDLSRVARLTGLPLREVTFRAEAAWRDRQGQPPAGWSGLVSVDPTDEPA